MDLKQHALGLLEDRMAGSESAQLAATVDQVWMGGVEDSTFIRLHYDNE